MNFNEDVLMALTVGCGLNNEAFLADARGDYQTAVDKYKQAIEIKLQAYGENSHHICISLSGLCDAYLSLGDVQNAKEQAQRMMSIAQAICDGEQMRIAQEILSDCEAIN